ncbi:MAG TPA: hypothetical protein VF888_06540, partial [Nitrospirota bacterium]
IKRYVEEVLPGAAFVLLWPFTEPARREVMTRNENTGTSVEKIVIGMLCRSRSMTPLYFFRL